SKYETLIDCEDKQHFRLLSLRLDQLSDETYGSDGSPIKTESIVTQTDATDGQQSGQAVTQLTTGLSTGEKSHKLLKQSLKNKCIVTETDATDGQQLSGKSVDMRCDLNDNGVNKGCVVLKTYSKTGQQLRQTVTQPIKVVKHLWCKPSAENTPKTAIATQSQSQDKKVVYLVVNSVNQTSGQSAGTSASGQQLRLISLGKVLRCHVIDCQFKCLAMGSLETHLQVHDRSFQPQPMPGFASYEEQRKAIDKQCYDSTTKLYYCRQTGCQRQKPFKLREMLTKHMRRVHSGQRYVCYDPNCDTQFRYPASVRKHYNLIHAGIEPPKRFVCPHDDCGYRCASAVTLQIHIKVHDNPNHVNYKRRRRELTEECYDSTTDSYHCRQTGCQKTWKKYEDVLKHMQRVHTDRTVVCEHSDCDMRFKSSYVMKNHYKLIHERLMKCPIGDCGREYRDRQSLNQHVITAHPTEYNVYRKARRANNSFRCQHPGCDRGFSSRYTLLQHQAIHNTEPTVRCPKCPQLFDSLHLLYKHKLSQHNIKPKSQRKDYRCERPGCQYTGTLNALRIHSMTHTGEKPYACDWPECGKRFTSGISLNGHMNIHQNLKPYACDWPGSIRLSLARIRVAAGSVSTLTPAVVPSLEAPVVGGRHRWPQPCGEEVMKRWCRCCGHHRGSVTMVIAMGL
ncbi:unnamed protein product, partial [Medioppia subpectinata]